MTLGCDLEWYEGRFAGVRVWVGGICSKLPGDAERGEGVMEIEFRHVIITVAHQETLQTPSSAGHSFIKLWLDDQTEINRHFYFFFSFFCVTSNNKVMQPINTVQYNILKDSMWLHKTKEFIITPPPILTYRFTKLVFYSILNCLKFAKHQKSPTWRT